ncbi:DUF2357 domain-containing protein [Flammeovirga pacifica]|uniref:DUF2357 domain-containing protein n=1 Tax=Flammeovirga pacifica TaxID=915059 RepID=A0A1S1YVR0_FLAPC|nr:DUF2357 domain-containing protein [Flammeovirga pacifica]OHX65107.1 hypothetical protein NH26_01435 [Flammeovirga pacifica]
MEVKCLNIVTERGIEIIITPQAENKPVLYEVEKEVAYENAESPYQLVEGFTYEWEIKGSSQYTLEEDKNIVFRSSIDSNRGIIKPNIFVGTLSIYIQKEGVEVDKILLEVRSLKATYRKDYRQMLSDISEYCTDLIMQVNTPINQSYTIDHKESSKSLYQKFSFVKSIVDSYEFEESIHQVLENPNKKWSQEEENIDASRVRRIDNKIAKQFLKSNDRTPLSNKNGLSSLPRKVSTFRRIDSVDTIENQFIKFVLENYLNFCVDLEKLIKEKHSQESKFRSEINQLINTLDICYQHQLFREVSNLKMMPSNNPLLQRKSGYREIYKSWLMFDLAAKLIWKGGDDVYAVGKRDVATLYEYWVFFALLEIIKEIFNINPKQIDNLISNTKDGLGLQLKQGFQTALEGEYNDKGRSLNIRFSYNRTFSSNQNIHKEGSWTKQMRPDYTLSIWPSEFDEDQAESKDVITHVHFDAKYKVNNITQLLGEDNIEDKSKNDYKRVDLLKMHAYKDAIRRSSGAYVIYPGGNESDQIKSFHEILPGLGAFPMKPTRDKNGQYEIKKFIKEVVKHFINRSSQREHLSYFQNQILDKEKDIKTDVYLPEMIGDVRLIPKEVNVIIGVFKNEEHLQWIQSQMKYNLRGDADRMGGMRLTPELLSSKLLLLYDIKNHNRQYIYEIKSNGPSIELKSRLTNYPSHDSIERQYFIFELEEVEDEKFRSYCFDVKVLDGFNINGVPIICDLESLAKHVL